MKTLNALILSFLICITQLSAAASTPPGIQHLVISPDNQRLVYARPAGQQSMLIRSIDTRTGNILSTARTDKPPHITFFGFTPDADKLLGFDSTTKGIPVIHNKTGKTLRTLPEPRTGYAKEYASSQPVLSPDGSLLALVDERHSPEPLAYLVNTGSKKLLHTIPLPKPLLRHSVAFSHDGKTLFWLARTQDTMQLQRYHFYQQKALPPLSLSSAYQTDVRLHAGPNGRYALLHDRSKLAIVDLTTGQEHTYPNQPQGMIQFADFISPQHYGLLLNTRNGNQQVYQWVTVNLKNQQKQVFTLPLRQTAGSITLSKNRRQLAVSTQEKAADKPGLQDTVYLLDTFSGKLIRRFAFAQE
ncbi:MAG: hypothetical protein R3F02_19920 [Thiolinea sp.]